MARIYRTVFTILYLTLLVSCYQPAWALEKGWILTQHSKIFGDQYMYVSDAGCQMYKPQTRYRLDR